MTDFSNSPLSDQDFLNSLTKQGNPESQIPDFSRSPLSNPQFLREVAAAEPRQKAFTTQEELARLEEEKSNLPSRTADEFIGDQVTGFSSALIGLVGGAMSLGTSGIGAATQYFAEDGSLADDIGGVTRDYAVDLSRATREITDLVRKGQSDTKSRNQRLNAQMGALESAENLRLYEKDIADGDSEFFAGLSRVGRDALDTTTRVLSDPLATEAIIAEAFGSLGPSAKFAKAGVDAASSVAQRLGVREGAGLSAAELAGSAVATGIIEGSGTYAETVNSVMGRSFDEMMTSPMFRELVEGGMNPEVAQKQVADAAGMEAFRTNLPAAIGAGVVAARFNANPIGTFQGKNMIEGLREVGAETFEEMAQGGASQIAQNLAMAEIVDDRIRMADGVGEQLAVGAIGGAGVSGSLGIGPSIAGSIRQADTAAQAARDEARFVRGMGELIQAQRDRDRRERMTPEERDADLRSVFTESSPGADLFNSVVGKARDVATGVKDVAGSVVSDEGVSGAVETLKGAVGAAREAVTPVVNQVIKTAQDYVERPNPVIQNEVVAAAESLSVAAKDPTVETGNIGLSDPSVKADTTPEVFKASVPEGASLADTMTGIVKTLSEKKIPISDMKDDAILFVAQKFNEMQNAASTLPKNVQNNIKKVLSSPDLERIRKRAARIDLNSAISPAVQKISSSVKKMTVAMSRLNPTNVNPDVVDRILKQENSDLTPEELRSMEVAASVARPLNTYKENIVKIADDKYRALVATGQKVKKPENNVDQVSRNLIVGNLTGENKVPSINELANRVIIGMQSPDQAVEVDGVRIPVKEVISNMKKLTQHMANKVNALNESFDKNDANGVGPAIMHDTLVRGKDFIKAGMAGSKAVTYNRRSPNSVAFAKTVGADAQVLAEVYNALAQAFPEQFPDGPFVMPQIKNDQVVESSVSETTEVNNQNTTAVEEVFAAAKTDEQTKEKERTERIFREALEDSLQSQEEGDPEIGISLNNDDIYKMVESSPLTKRIVGNKVYFIAEEVSAFLKGEPIQAQKVQENTQENTTTSKEASLLADDEAKDVVDMSQTKRFVSVFRKNKSASKAENAQDILRLISEKPGTEVYQEFAQALLKIISEGMNARLNSVLFSKSDGRTVLEVLREDPEKVLEVRDFKPLMIVNPETGIYDQRLLDLASMAVIDWMTTARAFGSDRLDDLLNDLGLEWDSLSKIEIRNLLNSVPTRSTSESLAKKVMKLWGVRPNTQAQMVDIRGTTEGLVKEIFTVLSEMKDPVVKVIEIKTAEGRAAAFDVSGLSEDQVAIGMEAAGSLDKVLFPEDAIMASFGEPITTVPKSQNNKPDVLLTPMEQAAVKKMQTTPHVPAEPVIGFFRSLGIEAFQRMSGQKDSSALAKRHPLRLTIEGKNVSIQRDYETAFQMVDAAAGRSVFYPVGVTNVGRHQMKGINPQNNKLLRALITPTHSKLNMATNQAHKNGFWLTVAQSSGLAKVEKKDHKLILSTIQQDFNVKFGEATAIALAYLETGTLDSEAFADAMLKANKGEDVSVAQMNAVLAVARFQQAQKAGTLENFETSLSFELDGKTDGPANMMVAFGQGLMTRAEFMNFKRVGLFLGSKSETLNTFLSGNQDLYEVNSVFSTKRMMQMINGTKGRDKERLMALQRFAAHFGDFQITEDGSIIMSRATSKNPMTKKVYGSGENGIAEGISQDMLVGFYTQLTGMPEGASIEGHMGYLEIRKDLELLFGVVLPKTIEPTQYVLPSQSMAPFADLVKKTIGVVLSSSIEEVMDLKTIGVNNLLVYTTNVQGEFMKLFFEQRLAEVVSDAEKDWIAAGNTGKFALRKLSQEAYDAVVKETMAFAPVFSDMNQNLRIGDFTGQVSNTEMSSNMSGNIRSKSTMARPDNIGVKGIPYVVQGRGDAMMMNRIFGAENAPERAIPIFDGIDMAVSDFMGLSNQINEAVLSNWDNDVIGPIVSNFEAFMEKVKSAGLEDKLMMAFNQVKKQSEEKTTVVAVTPSDLVQSLKEAHRLSMARKAVFKQITLSVDHMGGSGQAFVRNADGKELTYEEINSMIQDHLDGKTSSNELEVQPEVESTLVVTDVQTVMQALVRETKKSHLRDVIRAIRGMLPNDAQIVMGTVEEIQKWRSENLNQNPVKKLDQSTNGFYDIDNNIIFITSDNAETIVHEMIHMATFQAVLDHYNGVRKTAAVKNLEVLMDEFLSMDTSGMPTEALRAYTSAKAAILKGKAEATPMGDSVALNEFMAWTLANDSLMASLKVAPTSLVQRMTKIAKAWIQRILGVVPLDMYSNILFNTEMIRNDEFAGFDLNTVIGGNGGNGNNSNNTGEVTPPANNFTNFWIDLLRQRLADAQDTAGLGQADLIKKRATRQKLGKYYSNVQDVLVKLDFGGFGLSEYQKQTFIAIHTVIAAELRLDTNALVALGKMYEHITNNLTPAMFGSGQNAQDRYSTVMDLFGATTNDEGISDAIAVLLALSQTSSGFRKAMEQIPTPEAQPGVQFTSLNDVLTSTTGLLMQKMVAATDTEGKGVKEILDALSDQIIRQDDQNEFNALKGLMNSFTKADAFVNGAMSKLAQRTNEINREIQNSTANGLAKTVAGAVTLATNFLDADLSRQQAKGAKRATHMDGMLDGAVFIRELITEIIGADEINTDVIQMLDKVNYVVQSTRQAYREELPVILQNEFDNHPDAQGWKDLHTILGKLDFAALFDLKNPDESFDLLNDQSLLDARIAWAEKKILREFPGQTGRNILLKSQQLADFMNGKGAGFQLWKNAYAIHKLAGGKKPDQVATIDRLISLYALNGSDVAQRESVARMQASDPKGVHNLIVYMQALNKEEDQKTVSEAARMNGYKGYIPNHAKGEISLIIARDTDREDLERRGYVRVADDNTDTGSMVSRGYYMSTVKQGGNYSQGVLQQVQDTYRGVNSVTGLTVNGTVSGVISGVAVISITDALNNVLRVNDPKNVLIPVMDQDGGVLYYERALNPDLMEKYLEPPANMALMLGAWAGRQVEEKFSHEYNKALVARLKEIWDTRDSGSDGMFVRMDEAKDKIYAESWAVIPPQLKEHIIGVFGEETGFMVRKDMINLALGYRDPSIVDVWTGNNRLPEGVELAVKAVGKMFMGDKAYTWLANTETVTMNTISTAKDMIVVRSLVVPMMNIQSNVFQLVNLGIGTKKIMKGYREKFIEIDKLNENLKKIMGLEAQVRLAATDKNRVAILRQQIQVLKDENKRFSVAPLVEAGAYKTISEGLTELDVSITDGKFGDWLESKLNKLPAGVQTVAKYGLLSKDTALYKGANKATQYGDFVAKSIYYDILIEQGVSSEKALSMVNEEFVNYSVLPGRMRTGLESIGATWFLAYKIRSMKIALKMVRDNPVRSLTAVGVLGLSDGPVSDNLISKAAEGTLPYSLGWDMLWDTPAINPWVSLTNG